MKPSAAHAILVTGALALTACGSFDGPIDTGGYDPLARPGSNFDLNNDIPTGPEFQAGTFAQTVIPDSAFFSSFPKGDATADKVLPMGTTVKIIRTRDSFVQVELDDGSVGFVPSMMLAPEGADVTPVGEEPPLPEILPGGDLDVPPLPDPGTPEEIGAPVLPTLDEAPAPAVDAPAPPVEPVQPAQPGAPAAPEPALPEPLPDPAQ